MTDVDIDGEKQDVTVQLHLIWILQRSQIYFQQLAENVQHEVLNGLGEGVAARLLQVLARRRCNGAITVSISADYPLKQFSLCDV